MWSKSSTLSSRWFAQRLYQTYYLLNIQHNILGREEEGERFLLFPKICYCACAQVGIGVSRKSGVVYYENVYETLPFVLAVSLSKARYVRAGLIEQEGGFTLSFASGFFIYGVPS